ncbi:hypothetical protein [Saccharopolyspora pogona]|uniref:hypothetical protein n=1 Tax=Saccharopolyspora pogona TaxID=333966 RepID=UPI001685E983|nr:hypothetical protein [Saccharopolyspora pogona]
MINSLAGFALAATVGIGAIIGMLIAMSWVERRMLGSGVPRRESVHGRHRGTSRLVAEYRQQRAVLGARPRIRRNVPVLFTVVAALLALCSAGNAVRMPTRRMAAAGGPGAMRRPGPRHSFDRPTGRGSRRSRNRAKPRS